MYRLVQICVALLGAISLASAGPLNPDLYSVQDYGAHGDGKTDDTVPSKKHLIRQHKLAEELCMHRAEIIFFPVI